MTKSGLPASPHSQLQLQVQGSLAKNCKAVLFSPALATEGPSVEEGQGQSGAGVSGPPLSPSVSSHAHSGCGVVCPASPGRTARSVSKATLVTLGQLLSEVVSSPSLEVSKQRLRQAAGDRRVLQQESKSGLE